MSSKIALAFKKCRKEKRPALITYTVAGDNTKNNSLKILNADLSIAVTGIAGPTGGSVDKPVGLVWIGIGTKEKVTTNKYQFNGDRLEIRQKSTHESLKLANSIILEI